MAQYRQPTFGYYYPASVAVCINQVLGRPSAETWPSIGPIPSRFLLLLWHPVPKVEEPESGPLLGHVSLLREFGTASARCCAENKCWRPELGPVLAAKCIPELSFQQRHHIGNPSSANFWQCWPNVGPYLISNLGF